MSGSVHSIPDVTVELSLLQTFPSLIQYYIPWNTHCRHFYFPPLMFCPNILSIQKRILPCNLSEIYNVSIILYNSCLCRSQQERNGGKKTSQFLFFYFFNVENTSLLLQGITLTGTSYNSGILSLISLLSSLFFTTCFCVFCIATMIGFGRNFE